MLAHDLSFETRRDFDFIYYCSILLLVFFFRLFHIHSQCIRNIEAMKQLVSPQNSKVVPKERFNLSWSKIKSPLAPFFPFLCYIILIYPLLRLDQGLDLSQFLFYDELPLATCFTLLGSKMDLPYTGGIYKRK